MLQFKVYWAPRYISLGHLSEVIQYFFLLRMLSDYVSVISVSDTILLSLFLLETLCMTYYKLCLNILKVNQHYSHLIAPQILRMISVLMYEPCTALCHRYVG